MFYRAVFFVCLFVKNVFLFAWLVVEGWVVFCCCFCCCTFELFLLLLLLLILLLVQYTYPGKDGNVYGDNMAHFKTV